MNEMWLHTSVTFNVTHNQPILLINKLLLCEQAFKLMTPKEIILFLALLLLAQGIILPQCSSNCSVSYCSQCSNATCNNCIPGYSLVLNQCNINSCSVPNCTLCDSLGNCLQCNDPYASFNFTLKTCTTTCSIPNCQLCLPLSSSCQQCASGYVRYDWSGQCIPSPIANCEVAYDFGGQQFACLKCSIGFFPTKDQTQCMVSANCSSVNDCTSCDASGCLACRVGFSPNAAATLCVANPCSAANCLYCSSSSSSTCLRCSSKFVLSSGGSSCTAAPCNLANCLTCKPNSKFCDACQAGFILNIWTNQCETVPMNITNCQAFMIDPSDQVRCVACGLGLVPSVDRFSCVINCPIACLNCSNATTCSLCSLGYSQINGSCIINTCNSGCVLCTTNKTCLQCDAYTTLTTNATCLSSCSLLNCARCLNASSFCELCNLGFAAYSWNRKCIATPISHCLVAYDFSQQEFLCSRCSDGFVPTSDGFACVPMCSVLNCLTCPNSTICLACRPGFRLPSNQTSCVLNSCIVSNCLLCNSNGTCAICFSNFTHSNGSCTSLACNLTNCQTCKPNSLYCDVCATNFIPNIWSGKCEQIPFPITSCTAVQKDPSNQYRCVRCSGTLMPSSDGFSCITSCSGNCSSCANGKCFVCLPGYSLTGSSCQINPCSVDCQLCDSTGACLVCKNALLSYSTTTKSCVSFCNLPNCAFCKVGSIVCQQCVAGYSVYQWTGQCRTSLITNCLSAFDFRGTEYVCGQCLKGYLPTQDQSQCLSASCSSIANCQACNSTICRTCRTGYSLNANKTNCTVNSCTAFNCLSCSINGTCLRCASSFFLSNGQCLTSFCSLPYCSSCKQHSIFCDSCAQGYSWNVWTRQCQQFIIQNCDSVGAVSRSSFKCFVCSANSTCSQCSSLFVNQNGSCSSLCNVPHCITCLSSSYCSACAPGYILSSNYLSCTLQCSVSNCSKCATSNTICDKCSLGYKLLNNSCVADICSIVNCLACASSSSCLTCAQMTILNSQGQCQSVCAISNCKTCSSYITCAECNVGFLPVSPYACQPVCNITNCLLCRDAVTCSSCADEYLLTPNGTQCSLNCDASNCAVCANLGTCSSCIAGYTLAIDDSGYNFCLFTSCPLGSYASITNSSQCFACPQIGCLTCTSSIVCTSCLSNYYSSLNSCVLCSLGFANCLTCNSARCLHCQLGFSLNQGTCVANANCTAGCITCPNSTCTQCSNSFYLNSNKTCVSKCSTGVSNGSSCLCLPGLYMSAGGCLPCRDANCLTCDQILCQSCVAGYYPLKDACKACMDNCQICRTAFICDKCMFGYSLSSGACIFNYIGGTTNIQCPFGCADCTRYNNVPICKSLNDGFAFGLNSSIIQCSPLCKACSPTNASLCTSCYNGMANSGTCTSCSDRNCQDCSIDAFSCTNCNPGFTVKLGICVACANNCVKCNINGAGLCDSNGCIRGYTSLSGRNLCVKCPNGCSTCKSGDFSTCLSCVEGSYLSSGVCMPCPSNCSTCYSTQVCSICFQGFTLSSGLCMPVLDLPCAQSNVNSTCISCVSGYRLVNSTCQVISSSLCTSNCTSCPFGYYLAGNVCASCPALSNCLQCDQINPNICARCARGYFFNGTSCSSCDNNCIFCFGPQRCFLAKTGFFVTKDFSSGKQGALKSCKANCATCSDENHCTSCLSGWQLVGLDCVSSQSFNFSYVLKPTFISWDESWSASQQQTTAFNNWPQIYSRIQELAGVNNSAGDNGILIIRSIIYGSINITMTRIVADSEEASAVQSDLAISANSGVSGLSIISSSITTSSSALIDNSNSIYIGIFVGIGLLIIVVVFVAIFCVYRRRKIQNADSQQLKTLAGEGENLVGKIDDPSENVLFQSALKYQSTNMKQDIITLQKLKSLAEASFYPTEEIFRGTEEKERKRSTHNYSGIKVEAAPMDHAIGLKKRLEFESSVGAMSGANDPSLMKMDEPAQQEEDKEMGFQYVL